MLLSFIDLKLAKSARKEGKNGYVVEDDGINNAQTCSLRRSNPAILSPLLDAFHSLSLLLMHACKEKITPICREVFYTRTFQSDSSGTSSSVPMSPIAQCTLALAFVLTNFLSFSASNSDTFASTCAPSPYLPMRKSENVALRTRT